MTRKQRETIYHLLTTSCQFGEGWVKCSEIDRFGLSAALRLGGARALRDLGVSPEDEIILDGSFNYLPKIYNSSRAVVKADNSIPIVSAASIYAKVTRDRYMIQLAARHPGYDFEKHVGYGTKAHMLALRRLGALKYIHRQSFATVATLNGV